MKDLLIIGGVAAGATAAARARRLNGDITITILEQGADVSFANCGLPYYIGGDIEHRSSLILASPETFWDQYRVRVHTNTEALRIDRENQTVHARNSETGDEQAYPYDALILAQGGKPIVPPLPGVEKDHVFQLWTLDDMDRIDRYIENASPKRAAVVGGGFIGLEMAEALAKRGMDVSLVEMAPQIMPNLEPEIAGFLTKELRDYGVSLHLGTSLSKIGDTTLTLSDGASVDADMVLLSVGVRPTLRLATDAGLELGPAGGLKVTSEFQTSDPHIFASGDMVEIEHTVLGRTVRLPLAGPANRQGRLAAENAVTVVAGAAAAGATASGAATGDDAGSTSGMRSYRGAGGSSIVKVFDAAAGSTGLSLSQAREAGFDAEAVVTHKVSHTAYYPGAEKVSLMLVYERESGRVLGAQAAGRVGVDKRIDVIATAILGGLTVSDLAELDLAYAPPFNSPNGPINMTAFTAENQRNGFSPSVLARDLESFVQEHEPIAIDLRDPIAFRNANLAGSSNLSQNRLRENLDRVPSGHTILLISDDGQKGHVAARMLREAGFESVFNVSGGYTSIERHARAAGYSLLNVGLLPVEAKSVQDHVREASQEADSETAGTTDPVLATETGPLVIDVRTPMEFSMGAYPGAINITLDALASRADEIGAKDRHVILYCASGARSAYGARILSQMGYTKVENGGGVHDMMERV
ncbi:MAG: CoA-disulfide reductase [Spirochaetaceae bacterium]|nr:MAG: CoA-disulfide reductase [Spirochaetaceae bacterium]